MRLILVLRCTFELPQEPIRFVVMHQSSTVELLFMFADQCLYVNQSLNSNCSNHRDSFYNLFVNLRSEVCEVVVAWAVNGGTEISQI